MSKDLQSKSISIEADKAGITRAAPNDDDEKLRDFYAQHDVSVDHVFAHQRLLGNGEGEREQLKELLKSCHPHRFIRLNPRYDLQETLELIKVCCRE
jgi:hypothetical protein